MRAIHLIPLVMVMQSTIMCSMHDPEGSSKVCCPRKVHIDVARAGGIDQRVVSGTFACGFGDDPFRPIGFSIAFSFLHGVKALADECRSQVQEGDFSTLKMKGLLSACEWGNVDCGVIANDEAIVTAGASGQDDSENHCPGGEIPAFTSGTDYVSRFRMILDQGFVAILERYSDGGGRNRALFQFRFKPDTRDQDIIDKYNVSDNVLDIIGSCECEPYIAPPETECRADEFG